MKCLLALLLLLVPVAALPATDGRQRNSLPILAEDRGLSDADRSGGGIAAPNVDAPVRKDLVSTYEGWQHSGSVYILTTSEGADLPATALVTEFPLLVRLHQDSFDFSQAKAHGEDLRFSTANGTPLPYQIEHWDPANGMASVWVRLPSIRGNARQELKLHWGRSDAVSESNGSAVFNNSNGYLGVWHMNEPVKDEVGTLDSQDVGTTPSVGVVGPARHFAGSQGIFGGDQISAFPANSTSHTSEAWFRAERPNGRILGWGNEQAQGKVVMQFRSPPHITMDCYFSDGNVQGNSALPMSRWIHVVHTYAKGDSRVYVNGLLDGASTGRATALDIKRPARMWIGGWYHNYDFIGDIDEVRISQVARSADWIRLQHENQKPNQTLVGPVVQPGNAFSVSPSQIALLEGTTTTVSARAGGAQKIYWILKSGGRETLVATDTFHFNFDAGRVAGDQSATLQFKAVYANRVETRDIPITIQEDIPEPLFTLKAPATWDGRSTIEVVPQIVNLSALSAKGVGELQITWNVSDIAVIKENAPGKLLLRRAQNSGTLTVEATVQNGGQPTTRTATIVVTEPGHDAWAERIPAQDEQPEDNQFYPRDDTNEGTLFCNGTLKETAESVFLKVYADGKLYRTETREVGADKSYAFAVKLKPGLIRYSVAFGFNTGGRESVIRSATNLICGDAYIIQGQSNAVATDWGEEDPTFGSPWIRTFGSMSSSPDGVHQWGDAVYRSRDAEKFQVGYWGMELARRLVQNHQVPICLLNGAVGGTRIDQHQRKPENPEDATTIYGRLLWRARQAKLTHGIRGVIWHQGENDQGADGPTGGHGWETYRQYFVDLAAAWKQDYPNIQHYYVFQIWPKSCAMGVNGSDNRLREVQRTLPSAFSNLSIMSTLGIEPPGGCHYPAAGYVEFARLICPLLERDHYGLSFPAPITPPDLKRAYYAGDAHDEIVMEFDQPVKWDNALVGQFYLDGTAGQITSGSASGPMVTLKLTASSTAERLTYLDSKDWSQETLLRGDNGIAALTFCEVPISHSKPLR